MAQPSPAAAVQPCETLLDNGTAFSLQLKWRNSNSNGAALARTGMKLMAAIFPRSDFWMVLGWGWVRAGVCVCGFSSTLGSMGPDRIGAARGATGRF